MTAPFWPLAAVVAVMALALLAVGLYVLFLCAAVLLGRNIGPRPPLATPDEDVTR